MNTSKCLAAFGTTVMMVTIALNPTPTFAAEKSAGNGYLANQLGLMQKGSQLVGAVVRDGDNNKVGKIDQFVVDLKSGRVFGALVSPSGKETANEPPVLLPARSFQLVDPMRSTVDLKNSGMTDAPRFPIACPDQATISKSMRETYAHFNQMLLWNEKAGPGQVYKSGSLMGMELRNKADEKLGTLSDLMVDLNIGRIIYAVISIDGTTTHVYAVPPTALALSSDQKTLVLDAALAKINALAHPDGFFWTDMADPSWAVATYQAYGKSPDFETPVNTAPTLAQENAPGNAEKVQSPANKVAGKSDSQISQSVMTAVVRDDIENAFVCKSVKITTVNGHVTLSGKLKDAKLIARFAAIAETVVGPGNVSNLLASQ
jgi:sporulation protein YlmC with PRC-barrel domain